MDERLAFFATYARIGRVYLRWAPFLLLIALLVFVPVGLIHALTVSAEVGAFELDGIVELLGAVLALAALVITALLGEVFYTGAVAVFLTHAEEDAPPSLRQVAGRIRYWRLIAVDVGYGLLVAVGLALLIAPGVAAFVFFALAAPVVELEGRGGREAFARSAKLVRGRFWTVLALLLPLQVAADAATRLATDVSEHLLRDGLLAHWLAEVLANLAFTPLYAVAAVLIAVTLIGEKEGQAPRLNSAPVRS